MSRTQPTFHLAAKSGLIAAATAADAVLFHWRNSSASVVQYLHRLEIKLRTQTGYTAQFENALEVYDVSAFGSPAADYGGTNLSHPTTAANKAYRRISVDPGLKPVQETALASGNVSIAGTGAITHAGSPTIASHPWLYDSFAELVAGDAVHKGFFDMIWPPPSGDRIGVPPRSILPGAGFVIRNPVQTAATGTFRFWVSALWSET